jgi:hypothetical protein
VNTASPSKFSLPISNTTERSIPILKYQIEPAGFPCFSSAFNECHSFPLIHHSQQVQRAFD